MGTTPTTEPAERGSSRRVVALVIALLVMAALVLALLAVYLVFFASEPPAAPTLDDALKVLLASPSP